MHEKISLITLKFLYSLTIIVFEKIVHKIGNFYMIALPQSPEYMLILGYFKAILDRIS